MSIIYESLKKIEKEGIPTYHPIPKKPQAKKPKVIIFAYSKLIALYGIMSLIAAAAGIFAFRFFFLKKRAATRTFVYQKPRPQDPKAIALQKRPLPQKDTRPVQPSLKITAPLVLNGIFFSGNSGYALINNQIVKEGDVVEGSYVQKISEEEVFLKNSAGVTRLSTRAR
jgi:hypothetical protein